MNIFDIILLVLLVAGAIKGYQQGFVVEVFSFLAFFLGLFIALELTIPVAVGLFGDTDFFRFAVVIVFIAIFLAMSFGIKAGARAIKTFINFTFLGILDNLLGAIAGVLKWTFTISVLFWIFDAVGFDLVERYMGDAVIFPYLVGMGSTVFEWIGTLIPVIRDLIDSIESLQGNNDTMYTFLVHTS